MLNTIPYDTIDFDYMNLNQSAHGDREYAFINARLREHNKIIFGHWADEAIQAQIAQWMSVAVAYNESYKIKIVTFADKMRNVAVTDGDKIEAQIKFGWTVDYWGVGDLVAYVNAVDDAAVDQLYVDLQDKYDYVVGQNTPEKFEHNVKYQLREYLGLKQFMDEKGYSGFTTNFEDLVGLEQLPGLAVQLLMAEGYGFAGEGDWKTAALTRLLKIMETMKQRSSWKITPWICAQAMKPFWGHMLKLIQRLRQDKPRVEVHPPVSGVKMTQLDWSSRVVQVMRWTWLGRLRWWIQVDQLWSGGQQPEAETPFLPVAKQLWT